jgi:hypothetical protein
MSLFSKRKFMKTKFKAAISATRHLFRVYAGAVILISISAPAQNLFVADWRSGNIYEFTPAGVQSNFATVSVNDPVGTVFDTAGNLFVGADDGNIYEFAPSGMENTFATGLSYPLALAFNSTGDLFAENYSGSSIMEITTNGMQSTFATNVSNTFGLAFDRAGDLFISDGPGGNITEVDTNKAERTFASGLGDPIGLAFNGAGNLFVADNSSGNIYEFTTNGMKTYASLGGPLYLAFDSAGDLFVSSYNNIIEIDTNKAESTFASGLNTPLGLVFQPIPELQAVATNGTFQLTVLMPSPYYSTIVQASTNLVNWVCIYTNTPPFTFTDSTAAMFSCRFYRALLGP